MGTRCLMLATNRPTQPHRSSTSFVVQTRPAYKAYSEKARFLSKSDVLRALTQRPMISDTELPITTFNNSKVSGHDEHPTNPSHDLQLDMSRSFTKWQSMCT